MNIKAAVVKGSLHSGRRDQMHPKAAKLRQICFPLVWLIMISFVPRMVAATNDFATTLQKGLFEEEANHNYNEAIRLYESLISQFDDQRKLAATAIFRLGECYRKQGKTNEATAQYQRVLSEFGDQAQLAEPSRQHLAGLGVNPNKAGTTTVSTNARQEQKRLLEEEIKLVERKLATQQKQLEAGVLDQNALWDTQRELLKLKRQMAALDMGETLETVANVRTQEAADAAAESETLKAKLNAFRRMARQDMWIALQQEYPNPVLNSLMQKLAETDQNLVALNKEFGPNHSRVVEETTRRKTITDQIEAQVKTTLNGLVAKQNDAEARYARARGDALSGRRSPSAGDQDEEGAPKPSTAAEEEEVRRIQAMIKDSPDLINARANGGTGMAPLNKAANDGQLVVAQFLLGNGADVDVQDNGWTALHNAAAQGHRAMAELLLEHKARVNATDREARTPLHFAAEKGFRSVVELLLNRGADVNAKDRLGNTPIHLAVGNKFHSVVESLLNKGADVNASAPSLYTAGENFSGTPLHIAASKSDRAMIELLIKNKGDPNAVREDGKTPLDLIAAKNNLETAELLLSRGANVNVRNQNENELGWTALHYAVMANAPSMVMLLLKNKADPDARIQAGVNVQQAGINAFTRTPRIGEVRSVAGYTPLLIGATKGFPEVVTALLAGKANPNLKGELGDSPIVNCITYAEPALRSKILTALLEAGADTEARNQDQRTPLLLAAERKDKTSLDLLLAHKADVNARDKYGGTALHSLLNGASQEVPGIAKRLIDAGIDVNAQNNQGKTALDYLSSDNRTSSEPVWKEFAQVLRAAGAAEDLPRFDVIQISRPAAGYKSGALIKGSNDYNRFTLFELLAVHYGLLSSTPQSAPLKFDRASHTLQGSLRFPDLAHVIIRRGRPGQIERTSENINLAGILTSAATSGSCEGDVSLHWGDVVEIPEADHPISAVWQGLPDKDLSVLQKCLARQVQITVKGQTTNMVLSPESELKRVVDFPDGYSAVPPNFYLLSVLYQSTMLRASSDLSRVKVTRRDHGTGQRYEMVFDCSRSVPVQASGIIAPGTPAPLPGIISPGTFAHAYGAIAPGTLAPDASPTPDLWLRDGDQIEVPEKSQARE